MQSYLTKNDVPCIAGNFYVEDMQEEIWTDDKGRYHKDDGPAIIHQEYVRYIIHGIHHRIGGPAVECRKFTMLDEYYINDRLLLQKEYWSHPWVVEYKLSKILADL